MGKGANRCEDGIGPDSTTAQLAVTYMACQANGQCRQPVKNKLVGIQPQNIQ